MWVLHAGWGWGWGHGSGARGWRIKLDMTKKEKRKSKKIIRLPVEKEIGLKKDMGKALSG